MREQRLKDKKLAGGCVNNCKVQAVEGPARLVKGSGVCHVGGFVPTLCNTWFLCVLNENKAMKKKTCESEKENLWEALPQKQI